MTDENFDFVAFVAWFESLIDFIIGLLAGVKAKLPSTTTAAVEEEIV